MEIIVVDKKFKGSTENQVEQSLIQLKKDIQAKTLKPENLVKLNVFIHAEENAEFLEIKKDVRHLIEEIYKKDIPAFTIIAQPPLSGNEVLLEGHVLKTREGVKTERHKFGKHPYVVVSYNGGKRREVYSGGISFDDGSDFILDCQRVFDFAEQLLMKEDLKFGNVIRQWNYIPSILSEKKVGNNVLQNYQIFNDIRALHYIPELFGNGFPAATGIGCNAGNVTIDFIAVHSEEDTTVMPLKNPFQKNAYDYSGKVLKGEPLSAGRMMPPLFERGKLVRYPDRDYIYISGTASIRGERTVSEHDAKEQTKITLENIKELTGIKNLSDLDVNINDHPLYDYVRVYVKSEEDYIEVKRTVEENMDARNIVYVKGDICRNNLLVEIETDIIIEK